MYVIFNCGSYCREFTSLFVRGYLAIRFVLTHYIATLVVQIRVLYYVRQYCEEICSLVTLMLDTGFPCFRKNPIEELRYVCMYIYVATHVTIHTAVCMYIYTYIYVFLIVCFDQN